jgi:hypothetical protein
LTAPSVYYGTTSSVPSSRRGRRYRFRPQQQQQQSSSPSQPDTSSRPAKGKNFRS